MMKRPNLSARILIALLAFLQAVPALALEVNGELKRAQLEKLTSDPSSWESRVYWNTIEKKAKVYNGTTWTSLGAGGGTGEINLVGSPSEALGWTETGTVFDSGISTTSTTSDLPLSGLTDTAIKVTATDSGTEATDYVGYSFTTPASLAGKMKVQFYMRPGTGFAANEWTVSVYQGSTRKPLSTDPSGSSVSYLPNQALKYTTTVDLEASTAYTVRFARTSGAGSATLNIASVIVGPGIGAQGANVGRMTSYTPTIAGFGTPTNVTFEYAQTGDRISLQGVFTAGTVTADTANISLPSGWTAVNTRVVGRWYRDISSGSSLKAGTIYTAAGSNVLRFAGDDYTASATPFDSSLLGNGVCGSGNRIVIDVDDIYVNELVGSGTINLAAPGSANSQVRVDTGNGHGSTNTKIRRFVNAVTTGTGITYADSATLGGSFTINETGVYAITYTDLFSGATFSIGVSKNTSSGTTSITSLSAAERLTVADQTSAFLSEVSITTRLTAGDVIRAHTDGQPASTANYVQFSITKVADDVGQAVGFGAATSESLGLVTADATTFSVPWTASKPFTSDQSTTVRAYKTGKVATLVFPGMNVACSSTAAADAPSGTVPSGYLPVETAFASIVGVDAGLTSGSVFYALVHTNGSIEISPGSGTYTASSTCGWQSFSITYDVP